MVCGELQRNHSEVAGRYRSNTLDGQDNVVNSGKGKMSWLRRFARPMQLSGLEPISPVQRSTIKVRVPVSDLRLPIRLP